MTSTETRKLQIYIFNLENKKKVLHDLLVFFFFLFFFFHFNLCISPLLSSNSRCEMTCFAVVCAFEEESSDDVHRAECRSLNNLIPGQKKMQMKMTWNNREMTVEMQS